MNKDKGILNSEAVHYVSTMDKQKRWRACQEFAKVIYDSRVSDENLLRVFADIEMLYLNSVSNIPTIER